MLEKAILNQLESVFSKLEEMVILVHTESVHAKQTELVEMLTQVASTSENISVEKSEVKTDHPHFYIKYAGKENGIRFSGIPGGHEFSSLILAILNSDHKGKMPDDMIINRIKRLKGPINLKTYISLSCENCPDVVQALNIMASLNDGFTHEMVDGEFAIEETERLGIQGVPSVVGNEKLIHSGKSTLADLLEKLEKAYGIDESIKAKKTDLGDFDVAVIGGGPAGASAAIYTSRKGLKTVIITDRVGGQMQDTKGIENFISIPYTEGPELSAALAKHVEQYEIQMLEHRRVEKLTPGDLHTMELNSGESLRTKSVIFATGAKWRELGIEGEKEYMGRGVAFCPHCDGPYYKGKDISVIGGGNSGIEAAIDLAGIVKSVTVYEFQETLNADQVLVNKARSLPNVEIITNARTDQIIGNGEKVTALQYEDRATGKILKQELDGVFVQIGLIPNSELAKDVVEMTKYGEIIIDDKCRTNAKGIYAAGDVTTVPYKQIIVSMGEGAKAGLTAFEDIMLNE